MPKRIRHQQLATKGARRSDYTNSSQVEEALQYLTASIDELEKVYEPKKFAEEIRDALKELRGIRDGLADVQEFLEAAEESSDEEEEEEEAADKETPKSVQANGGEYKQDAPVPAVEQTEKE